jgi:hypothetical protein
MPNKIHKTEAKLTYPFNFSKYYQIIFIKTA